VCALAAVPLGALLAAACLVFRPVEIVAPEAAPAVKSSATGAASAPAPAFSARREAGRVYYVTGSRDRAKGVRWMLKRQQLFEGTVREVVFNEDELNLWFAWEPVGAPAPARGARSEWVEMQGIDFRIADGALCVGLPASIAAGPRRVPVLIQTRGGFAKRDDGLVMYAPDEIWVGAFPLHRVPRATQLLMARIPGRHALPGAGMDLWRKISRVTITGREMRVEMTNGRP
jgi:hypothetical protein